MLAKSQPFSGIIGLKNVTGAIVDMKSNPAYEDPNSILKKQQSRATLTN